MRKIAINTEFITLGQLLKFAGIIGNGGEIKAFLAQNEVFVNEIQEQRRGKKLFPGDVLIVFGKKIEVVAKKTD